MHAEVMAVTEGATSSISRIGFVGLGNMGWPMARQLARCYRLTVMDARTDVAESFASQHGVQVATDRLALADASDAVITMLPTGSSVREVALGNAGDPGLVAGFGRGSVLIDMSSSEPVGTRELAEVLRHQGVAMVDAPVSGGVARARSGSLTIMVGGESRQIARCRPILEKLGCNVCEVGGPGNGHAMKALNNYVSAAGLAAACEALLLGESMGLDPAQMINVLNASSGRNRATEDKAAQEIYSRKFNSGFTLGLMAKDVGIAAGMAEDVGIAAGMAETLELKAPLLEGCHDLWLQAVQLLGAQADNTEIMRLWEGWNGRELGKPGRKPLRPEQHQPPGLT